MLKLNSLIFTLLSLVCANAATIDLFLAPTKLRGANMFQQEKYSSPGAVWNPRIVAQDLINLRSKGANFVNFSVPGTFDVNTYLKRNDFDLKLEELISMASNAGLYVVIAFRTGPGRGEGRITSDGDNSGELFTDINAQNAYVNMWKDVALKYRNNTYVIGYDILVEPHDVLAATWKTLAQKIVDGIRTVDSDKPILVSGPDWGSVTGLQLMTPLSGDNIVYTVHQYDPYEYTHNDISSSQLSALDSIYQRVLEWVSLHGKPVIINEFGVVKDVHQGASYVQKQIAKIEELGLGHASWIWEVDFDPDYTFDDFDFKKNAGLMGVYQSSWTKNILFPLKASIPLPVVYSYGCGDQTGLKMGIFSPRLYIARDCVTGEFSLQGRNSFFVKNQAGSLDSKDGNISLSKTIGISSDDSLLQINPAKVDFKFHLKGSDLDGLKIQTSSKMTKVCLHWTGETKVKLLFGPNEESIKIYPGDKIDLANMLPCL